MGFIFFFLLIIQFFYPIPFISFLTFSIGILGIISIIYAFLVSKLIEVDWEFLEMNHHVGDQFRMYYVVKNNFFLPQIEFDTDVKCLHIKNDTPSTTSRIYKNQDKLEVVLNFKEIGIYEISLKQVRVFSIFRRICFKKKFPLKRVVSIYPMPAKYKNKDIITESVHGGDVSVMEKGDDYTEIFGFHEYRDNEPLKHVHPILSAKYDEYIIIEGSDSQRKVYVYQMKDAKKLAHIKTDLEKIYKLFLTIVLEKNEFFVIRKGTQDIPIYSHYDLYYFMDTVYQELLP